MGFSYLTLWWLMSVVTDGYRLAPYDWIALARTVLTSAQFTVWHSEYTDRCHRQQAENSRSGNPVQLNMLLETDEYESAEELVKMETKASSQCSQAAFCALKMVPEAKTGGPGSFINIRQGATEIYLDFIDWLQEAIQKQVESPEAAKTLITISLWKCK